MGSSEVPLCRLEAELSACCTAAVLRRSQSSPRTRRPSVVEGSGIARTSIAAAAIEDWGLLTPFVVVDAVVDIAGPPPGSSAITATSLLLLKSVSGLLQQESVLVDFCLELTELL